MTRRIWPSGWRPTRQRCRQSDADDAKLLAAQMIGGGLDVLHDVGVRQFHAEVTAVRQTASAAIRAGNGCVGFEQIAGSVTLRLANGEQATGDMLIGADHPSADVRPGQGTFHRHHGVAWPVPTDRLPPHQRRLVGANWMGVGGHVVTYPLRRGEILNFVGVVERNDWHVESWTERGSREEMPARSGKLARGRKDHRPQYRYALQMGAARARSARSLCSRASLPDWRRGASDTAVPGAGCPHGVGGCGGDRPLP
jgi:hypothetical protein